MYREYPRDFMRASNASAVVVILLPSSATGSLKPQPGMLGTTTWKDGTFSSPRGGVDTGLHSASIMFVTETKLSGQPWAIRIGMALGAIERL